MSGQMTHLKTILMVLAMMAGTAALPVQAFGPVDSKCDVTSSPLPFTNINLKSTGYKEGDTLKEFTFPIKYNCTVYYDINDKNPTIYIPTLKTSESFGTEIEKLDRAGLGLELTIQEKEQSPEILGWDQIRKTGKGSFILQPFGAGLPMDPHSNPVTTPRTGTLSGKIFATLSYQNAPVMVNIMSVTALNITPDKYGRNNSGTGVRIPSFYIRIFPDNLGQVAISPSVVDFGRIYATSLDTLTKTSPPFTVRAEQKTGTTYPFDMPLNIEFDTGGQTLTADNQAIILDNGLKLSITDTQTPDKKITFNQTYSMGTIHFLPSTGTGISTTYTAKVEPVPGAQIKTGTFNAAVTVKVTYQ